MNPEFEFMECEECSVKPGSPPLCTSCLHNRRAIQQLAALRGALGKIAAETLPRKRFRSFTVMNRGACADIARTALTDTASAEG